MASPFLLFFILVIAAIGLIALQTSFLRYMRLHQSETWNSLGRPMLVFGNRAALAILGFLWRKEYHAIEDVEFVRRASLLRAYSIGYIVLFAIVLIWGFVFDFAHAG